MRADPVPMRRALARALPRALPWALPLLWLPLSSPATEPAANPEPPQVLFKDLFVAVQSAGIFTDGKAFPDATPQAPPGEILTQFHAVMPDSPQALQQFVAAHFVLPAPAGAPPSSPEQVPIATHIDQLWEVLTRRPSDAPRYSSLLPLPRPFVVP